MSAASTHDGAMSIRAGDSDHSDATEVITDLDRVKRWQDRGGTWRIRARFGDQVTVSLCRCDVGEEMERLTSTDADLLEFLGDRDASDD